MAPMTLLPVDHDGWTVDDLDDLPDDGLRYELVDGALLVSPPPLVQHNLVANELGYLLHAALPPEWRVVTPGAIQFDVRNWRAPDLAVIAREPARLEYSRPGDVLLAVEVMSPGSVTTDRLVKPAQYAAAGIAHYWRIERGDTPVFITHTLGGETYRESGRFTDDVEIEQPVPLRFALGALLA